MLLTRLTEAERRELSEDELALYDNVCGTIALLEGLPPRAGSPEERLLRGLTAATVMFERDIRKREG